MCDGDGGDQNGLGRIGRATLKVLTGLDDIHIAAINDLVPVDNLAYLLRYDSLYGRYGREVGRGRQRVGARWSPDPGICVCQPCGTAVA